MTAEVADWVRARAVLIIDPIDRWARDRGGRGPRPRPLGPVEVRLIARVQDGTRNDLEPARVLDARVSSLGYVVSTRAAGLSDGTYAATVTAPGHRAADVAVTLPDDRPVPVELEPGPTYPFPTATLAPAADGAPVTPGGAAGPTLLRGTVVDPDGRGIADLRVEIPGVTAPDRTESSGQWLLVLPDDQLDATVAVRITGTTVTDVPGVPVRAGIDNILPTTSVSGAVVVDPGARGLPGATVEVEGRAGAARCGPDGRWRYHLPLDAGGDDLATDIPVTVVARHPDGRTRTRAVSLAARAPTSIAPFVFPVEA